MTRGKSREKYSQAFEDFWQAYPRRKAKRAAFKAWQRAVSDIAEEAGGKEQAEAIIQAGAARYAQERAGEDSQFTAHPSTWLNQDRWEDEPDGDAEGSRDHGRSGGPVNPKSARSGVDGWLREHFEVFGNGHIESGSSENA